jgi:H/ACA ribonucleoprotein complex subunit 4
MALVQSNPDAYTIKPEASAPAIDTSDWPLLLKNCSNCMQRTTGCRQDERWLMQNAVLVRTSHYTPRDALLSTGDLKSYISSSVINLDKPEVELLLKPTSLHWYCDKNLETGSLT